MDGNTVVALVVRRAELYKDTMRGAAGRERGMGTRWRRWWWGERSWIKSRWLLLGGREVGGMGGITVALLERRAGLIGTRCVVLLDGREVDGMDGSTVAALVVAG